MKPGRQLARMLAVMIVMIVAYLVPFAAEAHSGHRHLPSATVSASEAVSASHAISAPSQATAVAVEVLSQEGAAVFVSAADFDGSDPFKSCTGPCCCNVGMSCCAHALSADAGGVAFIRSATRQVAIPEDLSRPGVDSEALPKPPRTFA
jgi:hypothetical protein